MTTWIDFADLRSQVSLEDILLRFYALSNLKREGHKLIGPCPIHGGDSPRAFNADLTKNLWHCFSTCKGGGNQLDLVAKREGISIREAALKIRDFFAREPEPLPESLVRQPNALDEQTETTSIPNDPIELSLELDARHVHLSRVRKLTPETIAHFGLGYCGKGVLRGCVAIPIHNADGQLVAYAGRRLSDRTIQKRGKYVFPKGFRKEVELFNYHRAIDANPERLLVVEGFFGAIRLTQHGFANVVATMGTCPSAYQLDLLTKASELVVLYDGDEAGRQGTAALLKALGHRTVVRTVHLPENTGPDELGARAARWLVRGICELELASVALTTSNTNTNIIPSDAVHQGDRS